LANNPRSLQADPAPLAAPPAALPRSPQIDTRPLATQPGTIATSQRDQIAQAPQAMPAFPPATAPAADDVEVILIVRSRSQPQAPAEVMCIERPSRNLLELIAAQRRNTSQPAALQAQLPPAAPIIRGQD
jgi:hypothetical protein